MRTRSFSVQVVWSPPSHADNSDPGMSVMLKVGGSSNACLNRSGGAPDAGLARPALRLADDKVPEDLHARH